MLEDYNDIKSRIDEKPIWYDENGVPRYDAFSPDMCPDVYAYEVILVSISCQFCNKPFLVELSWNPHSEIRSIAKRVAEWKQRKGEDKDRWPPVHYGDPARHGCTGDTMNCVDLGIKEFWKRGGLEDSTYDWVRVKAYEIDF